MRRLTQRFSVSTTLGLCAFALFLVAALATVLLINTNMREQALAEAESKALMLLDRNLATHTYFSHRLKPSLFDLTDSTMPEGYFDPVWMSSTYAVRGMMEYFDTLSSTGYYYKECAVNARSPSNEADEYERAFIEELNSDPELVTRSQIRPLDGQQHFTLLRRGEAMERSCLRCHSTPDNAPRGMVDKYGPERSFNRYEGEVVSAVSIRIPIAEAYARADRFTRNLSAVLVGVLVAIFTVLFLTNRRLLLSPLAAVRDKALSIAHSPEHLGETMDPPKGKELRELAVAFNAMSASLKDSHDRLEERVQMRTEELRDANGTLREEIKERQRVEEELRAALAQVKTLKGLLPICASCKKIRDDEGYWTQIESFVSDHSEAEFSHGICPECLDRLYPDSGGENPEE